MAIQIHFLDEPPPEKEMVLGEIVIEDFRERFEAPLGYWSRHDYERQWREGLDRIARGAAKSCLITSMYEPAKASFFFWWAIYRQDRQLFIQNHMVFLDQLEGCFDPADPYRFVRDRETMSEDGMQISEWVTSV